MISWVGLKQRVLDLGKSLQALEKNSTIQYSVQSKLVDAYSKTVNQDLQKMFASPEPENTALLKAYLEENWLLVKGSCVGSVANIFKNVKL